MKEAMGMRACTLMPVASFTTYVPQVYVYDECAT
ncbi:hypothetical protein SAMN04487934_106121 [Eubacterium ruminantium]|nr:hypothetical protein SAMN04487934_106121 [Eubacterium ruminantium]